jgi:hypothetical protein
VGEHYGFQVASDGAVIGAGECKEQPVALDRRWFVAGMHVNPAAPRRKKPNETFREASPPRRSIGTDRHCGGCKAGLRRRYVI